MKKHFFLAAAAATMLVGCMDDGNGNNDPGFGDGDPTTPLTNLTIRLGNGGSLTRALEGRGKTLEGTNQLSNAHVFILDDTGTNVIDYAPVFGHSDLEAIKGSGWIFPDPIPADSKVYILGNVHSDYNRTVRDLETLAAINGFTSDIWTQADYNLATMANEAGNPVGMSTTSSGSATVSVKIAPVISRLELHSLRAAGNIKGFSVTGVFLTGYHAAYTYGGGIPTGSQPVDNSQALATNGGMTGDALEYPAIAQGSPLVAAMTGNRIWAYNVAARTLPMLIVRLENVLIGSRLEAGPLYLTVSSYGSSVTEFLPGKIYRISALGFTEDNLALAPVADGGISTEAVEWDFDELTPDINTPGAKITLTPPATLTDWAAADTGSATKTFTVALPSALTAWSVEINQEDSYFVATPDVPAGTFTIAPAAANTSVFERTATVRVKGDDGNPGGATGTSNSIQIKQLAAAPQMAASPSPAALSFAVGDDDSAGTDGDITFESNVAFSVTLTGANADMFTLSGTTSAATPNALTTYTINVVPVATNTSGAPLTATVTITNTDGNGVAPANITVTHNN